MLRLVALSLLLCSVAVAEEVKVQVMRDGKPAKGATVRLATTTFIEHKPVSEMSKPAMVDDVGSATIQLPVEYFTFTIYANDESGLFAASRSLAKSYGPIPAVIRLDLAKPATCSGRIVDPTGKPIQGLELTLRAARTANPKDSDEEHFQYIRLDPLDGSTVKTDEHGRYKFAIVPTGWHATVEFRSAKYGRGSVRLDSKENKDVVLAEAGSLKLVFDHADAKPSQFNFSLRSIKEDSKTLGVVHGTSIVEPGKEAGSYVNIVPGTHTFQSDRGAISSRIPDWSKSVEIKPGAETVLNIKTTAAVVISGRVVEKSTGKGIPDARIAVQGLKAYVFEVAVTDKEGRYTCRVPGDNQYSLYSYENFRAGERNFEVPTAFKNSRKRPDGFQTDMLQPGAKHEFPTLELREALTIRGKVERTDKKPFSGVCNVEYAVSGSSDHATVPKWDGAMFTLPGMPHDSGITLRLRQGNAVNVPERMDADKLKEEVTYSISEANAVTITGKVLDQKERGLAWVKVQLTTTRPVEGSMERFINQLY